jgi:hypothetical protein
MLLLSKNKSSTRHKGRSWRMNEDKCQEKSRKPSILSLMKKNFLGLRVLNVEKSKGTTSENKNRSYFTSKLNGQVVARGTMLEDFPRSMSLRPKQSTF